MTHLVMLSPATIELQKELTSGYHNTLCQVLALCKDMEERMSAIATHCDIAVDDQFDQSKWDDLCDNMTKTLREHKREMPTPLIVIG